MVDDLYLGGGEKMTVLLCVLFIGLKLTGYVAWSWLWVLSPLWAGLLLEACLVWVFYRIVRRWE